MCTQNFFAFTPIANRHGRLLFTADIIRHISPSFRHLPDVLIVEKLTYLRKCSFFFAKIFAYVNYL